MKNHLNMKHTFIPSNKEGIILLLHGNSSSPKVFKDITSTYSLVIPTLPGHATDASNDVHTDFSLEFYKTELLKLINSFNESIFLIGNSLGGHLAIEIANDVKNLKGLMIFGTPPVKKPINFEEAFLPVEALQTFLNANATEQEINAAVNVAVHNKSLVPSVIDDFNNTIPQVRTDTATDIMGNRWSNQHRIFTQLACRKIIVAPENDPSVNLKYLKSVIYECDDAELKTLTDCGHYPTLEKPEEMSRIIEDMAVEIFGK